MKWILAAALAVSLAVNVCLLARDAGISAPRPPGATGPAGASGVPTGGEPGAGKLGILESIPILESHSTPLEDQVAELETQIAAQRDLVDLAESMDPVDLILYSNKPLAWKARKLLEIEPEEERRKAAWKLGQRMREQEGAAAEFVEALSMETDVEVIGLLGEMLRAGGATLATPEDRRAFGELVRNASMPEVRAAAVRGAFMGERFGRGADEESLALMAEMKSILLEAMASDPSPAVVGAIAKEFGRGRTPDDVIEPLRSAAARLPASPGRRDVWIAIAQGTFRPDDGAALTTEFEQTTVQDVRDDMSAGMARASNSGSRFPKGTPEEKRARVLEARARFEVVYQGTSEVEIRRKLVRGALHGWNCFGRGTSVEDYNADGGQFLRQIAALEPDSTMRERLLKAAAHFEANGFTGSHDYDKILAGEM